MRKVEFLQNDVRPWNERLNVPEPPSPLGPPRLIKCDVKGELCSNICVYLFVHKVLAACGRVCWTVGNRILDSFYSLCPWISDVQREHKFPATNARPPSTVPQSACRGSAKWFKALGLQIFDFSTYSPTTGDVLVLVYPSPTPILTIPGNETKRNSGVDSMKWRVESIVVVLLSLWQKPAPSPSSITVVVLVAVLVCAFQSH